MSLGSPVSSESGVVTGNPHRPAKTDRSVDSPRPLASLRYTAILVGERRVTSGANIIDRAEESRVKSRSHVCVFAYTQPSCEFCSLTDLMWEYYRGQADFPAEQSPSRQGARIPQAHEHSRWPRHPGRPSSQGPREALRLSLASCRPPYEAIGGLCHRLSRCAWRSEPSTRLD